MDGGLKLTKRGQAWLWPREAVSSSAEFRCQKRRISISRKTKLFSKNEVRLKRKQFEVRLPPRGLDSWTASGPEGTAQTVNTEWGSGHRSTSRLSVFVFPFSSSASRLSWVDISVAWNTWISLHWPGHLATWSSNSGNVGKIDFRFFFPFSSILFCFFFHFFYNREGFAWDIF